MLQRPTALASTKNKKLNENKKKGVSGCCSCLASHVERYFNYLSWSNNSQTSCPAHNELIGEQASVFFVTHWMARKWSCISVLFLSDFALFESPTCFMQCFSPQTTIKSNTQRLNGEGRAHTHTPVHYQSASAFFSFDVQNPSWL